MLSRYPPSLRNYQRSISDGVQHIQENSYVSQDPTTASKKKTPPRRTNSANTMNNFRPRMLSRASQTTMLTNISKITIDTRLRNDNISLRNRVDIDNKPTKSLKEVSKRNGKYLDHLVQLFRVFNKSEQSNGIFLRNDSANSISNSSLQDMEEIEFSSSDLVKYMEEVNEDLT